MEDYMNPNPEEVPAEPENQIQEQPEAAVMETEQPAVSENTGYRGVGTGRRESPYANSPYQMPRRDAQPSAYEPWQPRSVREKPEKKTRKSGGIGRKILAVVAALALVIGSCAVTAGLVNERWEDRTEKMEASFNRQLRALQEQVTALMPENTGNSVSGTVSYMDMGSVSQIYARNVHSVVLIECTITSSMYGQTATGYSTGSGFILTEDGYVVTNYHVIEGATSVSVGLYDGTSHPAAVVGYDSTNDIALLKVEASGLDAVEIGSSDALIVGDQVVAIGNPLGELTSTLTVGYVSAKERNVSTDGTIINMIQTDAAINSGNSGGPLFNMKGQVVGITTAKYSGASSSGATIEGIGFAIPIDDVMDGVEQLQEYGYIKSAYLGVMVQNMDASTANVYGLPVGAYVAGVEEGFCAAKAGIQPKDIILAVSNEKVETIADLSRILRQYEPGEKVIITIYRGGQTLNLPVVLDERPANLDTVVPETQPQPEQTMPEGNYEDWFNFFAPFFGFGGD